MIELFKVKKECCGCGACEKACPVSAISMEEDECGFQYPVINSSKCIECKKCLRTCNFKENFEDHVGGEKKAFAAAGKGDATRSSSGGIGAIFASKRLENGVVYGCAFEKGFKVIHKRAETVEEAESFKGSKYVQSDPMNTFAEVRKDLGDGKNVLYIGTPCQIAGLYGYLGYKNAGDSKVPENLLTVDLVCHGVPSQKMFNGFLEELGKRYGIVEQFTFRDKDIGWGKDGSFTYNDELLKKKKKKIYAALEPYTFFFDKCSLFRESCYSCPFTGTNRPADITICDFWGVEKEHPDFYKTHHLGVSGVICNTQKGLEFFELCKDQLDFEESTFEKIARGNTQLRKPSVDPEDGAKKLFAEKGYMGLRELYDWNVDFMAKTKAVIKSNIPWRIKMVLKRRR